MLALRIVMTLSMICLFLIIGRGLIVLNSILNEQVRFFVTVNSNTNIYFNQLTQDTMKETLQEVSNLIRFQEQRVQILEEFILKSRVRDQSVQTLPFQ